MAAILDIPMSPNFFPVGSISSKLIILQTKQIGSESKIDNGHYIFVPDSD
jgi:hypothetical protein